ncbi:MAG: hypothetical protein AMJ43_01885 [Coxiella sp. DG_40]|nr:MAG: hypothetical protein AMJ43_01885 [Coxiella sp. DG_40]
MSWFKKLLPSKAKAAEKKGVPEGVWTKCPACSATLYRAELTRNLSVCPKCNHHMRISARKRLNQFLDPEGREEIAVNIEPIDRLKFRDTRKYKDRLLTAQKKTGEKSACLIMRGTLYGLPVVAAAFDFTFVGGSMGAAVGERFVQAVETCLKWRIPLVCFSSSGGARMQEGLISLMQMAKTSAAISKLSEVGIPFISILADPTTGGVSASLASLGDVIIAEPNAIIGFAGRRVIEQTVRQQLPENFQRSEFLFEHGAIDMIVDRRQMRSIVVKILAKLTNQPSSNV